MSAISDLLKSLAAFLDISYRAAFAFGVGLLIWLGLALYMPTWGWWSLGFAALAFCAASWLYPANWKARRLAGRIQRERSKSATAALKWLKPREREFAEYVHHSGGVVRVAGRYVVVQELEALHVLERFDYQANAQEPMIRFRRGMWWARVKEFGWPTVSKAKNPFGEPD